MRIDALKHNWILNEASVERYFSKPDILESVLGRDVITDALVAPLKQLHLEEWNSNENRQERHYFLRDGMMHGYQQGAYVFGYNPALVSEQTAMRVLALINDGMK